MTDLQRVRFACWLEIKYGLWGWLGPYCKVVEHVRSRTWKGE